MFYTIGEMAKKLNIAPSAIRYYDKEGLLPFIEKSESGKRLFKDSDFEWFAVIECLKQAGMQVKDIKNFIDWCMEGDSTIDKCLALIEEQKKQVEEKIAQMKETLKMLEYKQWYYETAKEAKTCKIHEFIKDEDVPEDLRKIREKSKGLHIK